ncbi:hypothetical protein BS50DRAFT_601229 [Corynespora cassiicola Philippines]|uniref:F-box domain-containing protein n=1 Tax=Corynespora cassiicola Philippines TaxID=1448308 RepID=A0A2T2NLZ2_CORCC|nr:hypothetical protein BS50DRAFT_601229 [Corynespora cassiicola Philippines]
MFLHQLPFDILFYITLHLNFDDIIHLGFTCRELKSLLDEPTLCRKAIQTHFPHSKEAQLAKSGKVTYTRALRAIHDRRDAFFNASPFSARVVGQGSSFLYRQGVLCVLNGSTIHVSDPHTLSSTFEMDIHSITSEPGSSSGSSAEPKVSLLHYSHGIVTVHCERKGRILPRIYAINTKDGIPIQDRIVKMVQLESSYKLFARHTAEYLYWGTYTGDGTQSRHEWEIYSLPLDSEPVRLCDLKPIQLQEFFGTDLGSTVAFEIFNGHFYALSNQTSFEVEELDWTSFYHCIRFPVDRPEREAMEINTRVYRRQHAEGPIHDSWTDLSLQLDEYSSQPVIVEARREWVNGTSRQLRTYYMTEIEFPTSLDFPTPSEEDGTLNTGGTSAPLLPLDDAFTGLLDSTNNPNYAPTQTRFNWNFQPEFPPGCQTTRSFILARTKFRAYDYSSGSFLDLVEDEKCCGNHAVGPCLRIRIGSRRHAPIDGHRDGDDKLTYSKDKLISWPVDEGDVAYRHSAIRMWPPKASACPCSQQLHDIMNPKLPSGSSYNRIVTGALDERSLIYMVKPGRSYGPSDDSGALGTIIMVNFSRSPFSPDSINTVPLHHEHENENEASLRPDHWQWIPGQTRLCREGRCC